MESGAFGVSAVRSTPADAHGPTAVERKSHFDLQRMFDRFASSGLGQSQPAILREGFHRMIAELFPCLDCTPEQVAEGFVLADVHATGRLEFDVFIQWCVDLSSTPVLAASPIFLLSRLSISKRLGT